VPITILLVIAALGPAKWAPRTEFGWQFDHFIGYFGITLFFCFAWLRPFVVGGAFMAVAALLEGLQAFTPDRSAYLPAVFYGAAGALAAALVAELVIRAWRLHARQTAANVERFLASPRRTRNYAAEHPWVKGLRRNRKASAAKTRHASYRASAQ
jgi:hypothetical protein